MSESVEHVDQGHTDLESHTDTSGEGRTRRVDVNVNDAQYACWGKHGKLVLWLGLVVMWTAFELDHTALYNYQNYAASDLGHLSSIGAIQTAGTIVSAVLKPPIAKISDVVGRIETYAATVALYVVSYIVCATAPNFAQYAGGFVIYSMGGTGMQILNQIIVADITSSRWRGLANGLINLPFMIIPWTSAFMVESTLKTMGWRWGIGMFAIIMPVTSLSIIVPLLYFRHRSKKIGVQIRRPTTVKEFLNDVDAPGILLLTLGCTGLFLPMALASSTSKGWLSPWPSTVTVAGAILLALFAFHETRFAANPVIPGRYFKSASLVLACLIGFLDAFAFQITHTYMYAWSTVAHNFSARDATFLTYTAGCFQVLSGLLTGFLMYRSRRYKWLLVIGAVVRLAGYGVMFRLRDSTNAIWELFLVQAIQGIGSGIVGTVVLVVAQITVPKAELAQATALILLSIFMGQAVGSAVAGAIYTNLFRPRLRAHLGPDGSDPDVIDAVFQSITSPAIPRMDTPERTAINAGYTDVLRYMSISALVASAVPMLLVWWLPNLELNDQHSLCEREDVAVNVTVDRRDEKAADSIPAEGGREAARD